LTVSPLSTEAIQFIRENENADTSVLLLKSKSICGLPASFIVDQIFGRKKAKAKLPSLYHNELIIFPPSLNLEQSSSELTAKFKLQLLAALLAKTDSAVDLTGGFGVDTISLRNLFKEFHYVEPQNDLLQIVQFNCQQLHIDNVKFNHTTAEKFIAETKSSFDAIYIDPSRRLADKKVVSFKECSPDITGLQNVLFQKSELLLIKAAPMLDIKQGLRDLSYVFKVIVLSVKNDCKEILFICKKGVDATPMLTAVNLDSNQSEFSFTFPEEESTASDFSACKKYLFEPNSSILKAGAFKAIGKRFGLPKLHIHTHLYTSDNLIHDFPGRVFEIINEIKLDKKQVRDAFPEGKANVVTRNYPLSPDELKKKLGLQDGGELYLIGLTDIKKKVLVTRRIS
jgi:hypothetical protein